ncbi:hypothetical protein [Bradyrhizobium ottawaense]|nr:hypothetical protein [Bradyrhizobium ottawaense]
MALASSRMQLGALYLMEAHDEFDAHSPRTPPQTSLELFLVVRLPIVLL